MATNYHIYLYFLYLPIFILTTFIIFAMIGPYVTYSLQIYLFIKTTSVQNFRTIGKVLLELLYLKNWGIQSVFTNALWVFI